jgi:hypothetical protein
MIPIFEPFVGYGLPLPRIGSSRTRRLVSCGPTRQGGWAGRPRRARCPPGPRGRARRDRESGAGRHGSDVHQRALGLLEALGLSLAGLFERLASGIVAERRHLAADPSGFGAIDAAPHLCCKAEELGLDEGDDPERWMVRSLPWN